MPEIPPGAKVPTDHQPSQAAALAADAATPPAGAELLRPAIDIDFDEEAEFIASLAKLRQRGTDVELTSANLKVIAELSRFVQNRLAVDSAGFRSWMKNAGSFEQRASQFVPLVYWFAAQLGEGVSSGS